MNRTAGASSHDKSDPTQWDRIAESKEFKDLVAVKKAFIIPGFIFFFGQYLGLNLLVGYAPRVASVRVVGTINVGYLIVLLQFALGWLIAALYSLIAAKFDALTKDILARVDHGERAD